MIFVEFICRLKKKKRMLQIGSFWLTFFICLCIFSSIIGGMRFGAISLFFMSLTALIFIVIDNENFNNKAKGFVSISVLILCTLPLIYNAKNDVRWQSLLETIPIAIDTDNNSYWRDLDNSLSSSTIQKLSDGFKVYRVYMKFNFIKSLYLLLCLSLNYLKK